MRRLFFTLLFCFLGFQLKAQIDFIDHVILDNNLNVSYPQDVHSADLDGDGDLDLISASSHDNKIAWYENLDGQGKFGTLRIISEDAEYALSVYTADFDGDGDMDVVSSSGWDGKIAWYENVDSAGSFGVQQVITQNTDFAMSVYAADLDGDGDMDVLSASLNDNRIAWYENTDGQGDFGVQQNISTNAEGARKVHTADLDGDGDMDVLSASADDDKIAWYENLDGQGNFGSQQIISSILDGANSVLALDVDNDNDMDVVACSFRDDRFVWFENLNGQASFGTMQLIDSGLENPNSIYTADIDMDNDLDLFLTTHNDDTIAWYENIDGEGDFGNANVISSDSDYPNSVYAGDINGDGFVDAIATATFDHEVVWFQNLDGLGTFGQANLVISKAIEPQSVVAADIDEDGDMDVLSASKEDDKIAWYENMNGLGTEWVQNVMSSGANSARDVSTIDIDNDGDLDVLSASYNDGKIAWYENLDGLGDFSGQQLITTNANLATSVLGADLDGDGDNDVLFCSGSQPGKIGWIENTDGIGTFGPLQVVSALVNRPRSVSAADIDGDGDNDIIVASSEDDKIAWYENTDGQGNFGQQIIVSTESDFPMSVFAVDIDGDNDIDILSGSYGFPDDKILMWFENTDGQGTFDANEIQTSSGGWVRSAYAEDIDGDGDMDVVATLSSTIAYFENLDGQGNFGEQYNISWAGEATSVFASDINGDGRMDVISAAAEINEIAWYENTDVLGTERSVKTQFILYPVPTTDILHINSKSEILLIEVYNQLGQLILSNKNDNMIDLTPLNSGLYYVKILDEYDEWQSKKVLKK